MKDHVVKYFRRQYLVFKPYGSFTLYLTYFSNFIIRLSGQILAKLAPYVFYNDADAFSIFPLTQLQPH